MLFLTRPHRKLPWLYRARSYKADRQTFTRSSANSSAGLNASLGRLLAGLLVVFANHVYADDPRRKGTWQIIDADFSDIGHCLMTQTLEITLKLGERQDGKDGPYIESFSREGDSGGCPSLGFYRILYDVKLTPALRSKS